MSGITGTLYIEDIATQMLTYNQARVYSDSSPTGAFSTLVDTLTLVAAQEKYDWDDAAGTVSTWYRWRLYNTTGPVSGDLSSPFRPSNLSTLRSIRIEAAKQAQVASSGVCSSTGTTTTLFDTSLLMSGHDAYFKEGAWLYRPDAGTATDVLRRVTEGGFSTSTGGLSIPSGYPWSVAPASAEAYELYNLVPPVEAAGAGYSWNQAVRDGIRDVWFRDQLNLGEGTSTGTCRFSLQQFGDLVTRASIYNVMFRTTDSNGEVRDRYLGMGGEGTFWSVQENDTTGLTLVVSNPPSTTETVIVEVARRFEEPFVDTDVITGPQSLAIAATNRQLFWKVGGENDPRYREWHARYRREFVTYGARPRVLV